MINVDEVISLLNEVYKLDPELAEKIVELRAHCNESIAAHPTIQVAKVQGEYLVGILGILNGLCGKDEDGYGYIAAMYDDKGLLTGFKSRKKVENFNPIVNLKSKSSISNIITESDYHIPCSCCGKLKQKFVSVVIESEVCGHRALICEECANKPFRELVGHENLR
jgi:hypothetical protein